MEVEVLAGGRGNDQMRGGRIQEHAPYEPDFAGLAGEVDI
jgi:hypothetical protein